MQKKMSTIGFLRTILTVLTVIAAFAFFKSIGYLSAPLILLFVLIGVTTLAIEFYPIWAEDSEPKGKTFLHQVLIVLNKEND